MVSFRNHLIMGLPCWTNILSKFHSLMSVQVISPIMYGLSKSKLQTLTSVLVISPIIYGLSKSKLHGLMSVQVMSPIMCGHLDMMSVQAKVT